MSILQKEIIIGQENVSLVESKINDGVSIPLIRTKTLKTSEYLDNLSKKMNHGIGTVLPKNCRFVLPINSNTSVIVVEDRPKLRSVSFKYDFRREHELIKITGQEDLDAKRFLEGQREPYHLKLSFPYIVYIMLIQEKDDEFNVMYFNVFFRAHPITRPNDYLNIANIFNLGDANNLCFGRSGGYNKNSTSTLSDLVDHLIADFWNRPFTDEYQSRHYMYQNHSRLHSFLVWAHYSVLDPMFIYSTNWVIHQRNLMEEINFLGNTQNVSDSTAFRNLFVKSTNSSIIQDSDSRKFTYDTMVLTDQILSLGDQIRYNDQDLYLYNLIGDRNKATHVVLIDDGGKLTEPIELTGELIRDWELQVEKQLNNYVDEVKFGDKIAKVGSIIKIIPNNTYEIIQKIRLSRDKRYEFVLGKRFYMATEGVFEVIDALEVNGVELKHGIEYLVCNNQHQIAFRGKLLRIENNNYNVLYFFFEDMDTGEERGVSVDSLEDNDTSVNLISDQNIIDPSVFRYLNRLYTNDDKYIIIKGKGVYSKYSNTDSLLPEHSTTEFPVVYNSQDIIQNILFDNEQRLTITGVDIDINFQVGDEIIIGDWNNPDELMFKIRKITGFEYNNIVLNFKVIDSDENETTIEYINIQTGYIKIGYIRKVKSEYEGIVVGTRIKSVVCGYFNFPKRTNYEIAAFIIDSERPMILLKNGHTIWFDELRDNFEILSPGSEGYRRIRSIRALESDKIQWQSGDICKKDGKLYLVNNGNEYMGIIYMGIDPDFVKTGSLRTRAEISEEINPDFIRYGIISPRYRKRDSIIVHESIPTFHNGYMEVPYDGYYPCTIQKTQEVNE